ncbi:hypothetical protein AU385_13920 [Bacillus halotolerans]|uniref:hypothetical protein n=1 Tax=Bacillus halotolerans TaxID=260554 RepID=UPI000750105C|nr:hypothetical protein [Bacillus halotolerans]KUP31877.1 hypothetical protein AU385_13920 [Bacillus halotolerans]
MWFTEIIKKQGFGELIKELILLEWTISEIPEKEINDLLPKYNLKFERKIIRGINVFDYENELNLLKEKNHPIHALSRVFHVVKTNSLPEDFLNLDGNIEEELTEKSTIINATYLALKMAGKVETEDDIIPNQEVIDIFFKNSPCTVRKQEMKHYAKTSVGFNYFERIPELFSKNC